MTAKSKILIVDDSRTFRTALEAALAGYNDIDVVGSEWSGPRALAHMRASPPDLVTLDVAMPGMNGLETLRAIQQFNAGRPDSPPVGVIMVSVSTSAGASVTVEALQEGAFDFVAKPAGTSLEANMEALAQELVGKIRQYAHRAGRSASGTVRKLPRPSNQPKGPISQVSLPRNKSYRAVVIAVSTGGPKALERLLPALCERIELPVLVVQHMPPEQPETMTTLVRSLAGRCKHPVIETRDGGVVTPGTVYFAPGNKHLVLRHGLNSQVITTLTEQPPESGFRPSADVLFRSAAHVWGGDVVALILTGMLEDGTRGLEPLKRAGAHVIAQDEETSVVWSMPGSAVAAGLVDQVLPLERIAPAVEAVIQAGRRC